MSEENPTNKPPPPELRQVTPGMQELAQVEGVRIMMDRCAHSFALGINSPVGLVTQELAGEALCRLGVELIRQSGYVHDFTRRVDPPPPSEG